MLYNKQKFVKCYLKQYFKIISNLPVASFFLKLSPRPPCGWNEWIFSGIFDKVGSSEVVYILLKVKLNT